MLQTDDIHESFYDLFNQHFRKIPVKGEGGKRTHFYANVAIGSHSKPCRVHPKFQCIVVIKESDLATTPAPFLNRFEKYRLSPKMMLEAALDNLPRGLRAVVHRAEREVSIALILSNCSFLHSLFVSCYEIAPTIMQCDELFDLEWHIIQIILI